MKVLQFPFPLLILSLILGCGGNADENKKSKKDILLNNSAIVFHDLDYRDTVNQGDTVNVTYRFFNDGYQNLEIKDVRHEGWCKVSWTKGEIMPVVEGAVEVSCVMEHTGMIKQAFMVAHNAPSGEVPLTMRIFVRGGDEVETPQGGSKKLKIK